MRVITGSARGRKLKTPANYDIRPTTDNVKEAVFNIIQFDIEGRRVLDLFAGTGQLGIECLSRGAAEAVFIDQSRDAVGILAKVSAGTASPASARMSALSLSEKSARTSFSSRSLPFIRSRSLPSLARSFPCPLPRVVPVPVRNVLSCLS